MYTQFMLMKIIFALIYISETILFMKVVFNINHVKLLYRVFVVELFT